MNADAVIKIVNVSKTYSEVKAVSAISFDVSPSTCFGLLGPNGAGKTTLMKMLYGASQRDKDPDSAISVFGFDPQAQELHIKAFSGVVPQDNNLDDELNVWQNLFVFSKLYGIRSQVARGRIEKLLEFMELADRKKARIKELSGGMKRRLTIARALLNDPKLLILDEPTTGLDPQVRHLIWNKLRKLIESGVTIVLTTHYMEEAFQICDRNVIMDKGSKVLDGNPTTLLKHNMEDYVLEINTSDGLLRVKQRLDGAKVRRDEYNEITFLFSNDFTFLRSLTEVLNAGEFYLRPSNLEDLFLKTTGRLLNETQ
jgi:lipooligosaccharide transport system ATP-binding protein